MARTFLTVVIIVLLNILVGCGGVDSGKAQLVTAHPKVLLGSVEAIQDAKAGETDIVEQMAVNRQAYRQGLNSLVDYYTRTGNNMKLTWAKKELSVLNTTPQYNYILEASIAGPDLKASASIPEADDLYFKALSLDNKAGWPIILKDENLLRLALDKYNQLIRKYPTSDKIDDAAYKAAQIYEYFKDYSIAVLYYQRTYQWDPETVYSARFRAACILDLQLHRRAEALELYQQAVKALKSEDEHKQWKEFAQERIKELTKSDQGSE